MKVRVKHWRGVASWKWEIENEDVCFEKYGSQKTTLTD